MTQDKLLSAKAALPENYLRAKRALRNCAKDFSPINYFAAIMALEAAWTDDQVKSLPDAAVQFATYSKIADDNELMRLAARVEVARREWSLR